MSSLPMIAIKQLLVPSTCSITKTTVNTTVSMISMPAQNNSPQIQINSTRSMKKVSMVNSSPPMVILGIRVLRSPGHSDDLLGDENSDASMVPPHVIVGCQIAEKMTSSACVRNGRTLKDRYLSEVRNSVLRMTGFSES